MEAQFTTIRRIEPERKNDLYPKEDRRWHGLNYFPGRHTWMKLSARISASVEGTLDMMGRQVPITIEMKVNMKGQKIK